ncbi:NAD(P)/FAD-dependent oxidoreductase [Blastococcus sp. SYSU DS0510]
MTRPEPVDVLVVGAGLAGLHTATSLARRGHDVLLADRRTELAGAIRTTGIFVQKTLDDFPLPAEHLGPPIRRVLLYPPDLRRPLELVSGRDEFRVGDMAGLYRAAAASAEAAGVRLALGTRYVGRRSGRSLLAGRGGPAEVRARFVVGADGARSRVARDLGLDRNDHLLVGAEEVFDVPGVDGPPTFHCVLDPSLAPGYLAWVVNDGRHAHVGVAGYGDRFPHGLRRALDRFASVAPGLADGGRPADVERRGGPIPVGGLLRRSAARRGSWSATRRERSRRSPPADWTRACGCPSTPSTSWTGRCARGIPRCCATTTAPRCAPASAAGCSCAGDWRRCGRRPWRRRPSGCSGRRWAGPRRPASSSVTGRSPTRGSALPASVPPWPSWCCSTTRRG